MSDWRRWWANRFEASRLHLAHPDALLLISMLGLLTGLFTGAVVLVFRLAVESSQELLLPGSGPENYEALLGWQRLALPVAGGVLLALLFKWVAKGLETLGVAGVIDRMTYHQGYISARGLLLQFAGAAVSIVTGYSVGREGPLHEHRLRVADRDDALIVVLYVCSGNDSRFPTTQSGHSSVAERRQQSQRRSTRRSPVSSSRSKSS